MTKWGDRPHWQFGAVLLGQRRARRLARPPGRHAMARPGAAYVAPVDQVVPGPAARARRGPRLARDLPRGGGPGAGLRRHDDAARLGRAGAARGRPRPGRGPRARPGGCGSTTRTSSPRTGCASATPTRSPGWRCDSCDRVQAAVTAGAGAVRRPRAGLARAAGRRRPLRRPRGSGDPARRLAALGATGADPQRADQARTGQPALQARASRLSGWATYSPRITPDESAIATDAAVTIASSPSEWPRRPRRAARARGRSRGRAASAPRPTPRRPAAAPAAGRRRCS